MKKNVPMLICLLVHITFASAQINLQWQKNFGGTGSDAASSIKPTVDGGYIVAGQSSSTDNNVSGNHGGIDYWIAKLDVSGNIQWQKSYGGSGNDIARCIQPALDGGYIIAGYTDSYDGDITDHGRYYYIDQDGNIQYYGYAGIESWIVKIDNAGTITWAKTVHNMFVAHNTVSYFPNYINTVIQASNGDYIFGGNGWMFFSDNDFFNGAMIVKLNSSGNFTGTQVFFESGVVTGLTNTAAGFTATGYGTGPANKGGTDIFVSAFTSYGTNLWEYSFGGSNNDKSNAIQLTADNGYILAGSTASSDEDVAAGGNHGAEDYLLMKLSSSGALQWSKCFGGTATDVANAVLQAEDGGYFIGGSSSSVNGQVTSHVGDTTQADYWFVKTTAAGSFSWSKSYGGTAADEAYSLAKTPGGGYIAAGYSASADAGFVNKGSSDYWLLKFTIGCGNVPAPVACDQHFCSGSNPVVAQLVATGTNLKWYSTITGGCAVNPAAALVNGNYFVSQTVPPGCESTRKGIHVTVNHTPNTPPAPATQHFCAQQNPKVCDLRANGTLLKWYKTAAGGSALSNTAPLVTGFYYVSQTSLQGCESSRNKVSVAVRCCNHIQAQRTANDDGTTGEMALYPNPAKNIITIRINTENTAGNISIRIMDVNGKILLEEKMITSKGTAQKAINVSGLANGLYIVQYAAGNKTGVAELQVQR